MARGRGEGGKGAAEANCARDRENKLSPLAAMRHPPRATGVADARRGKGRTTCFASGDSGDSFLFFPPLHHQQRCLNTPAREYLVTAVSRARYRFISHYRVRATIPWARSSLPVCTSIVDTLNTLPCRCGSTCRTPSRGITINLRGINRPLLRAAVGASVRCSPWLAVSRYCERDTFTHI